MKTYSAKPSDVIRKWYIIDAGDIPLGRMATQVADLLTGKNKPMYTKHIDCGDHVVIINADKLVITGKKLDDKMYYKHSGYPGGLTETNLKHEIEKDSTKVIFKAIRGMLPINKLRDARLARLKIYAGNEHSHSAQQPIAYKLKGGK